MRQPHIGKKISDTWAVGGLCLHAGFVPGYLVNLVNY